MFSDTVNWRSSVFCWLTIPRICLARAGWATTSIPPTKAWPAVGTTRVVSMPAVVVLPAPLGPSRPKISPWATSRSRHSTAGTSDPGVDLGQPHGADDGAADQAGGRGRRGRRRGHGVPADTTAGGGRPDLGRTWPNPTVRATDRLPGPRGGRGPSNYLGGIRMPPSRRMTSALR